MKEKLDMDKKVEDIRDKKEKVEDFEQRVIDALERFGDWVEDTVIGKIVFGITMGLILCLGGYLIINIGYWLLMTSWKLTLVALVCVICVCIVLSDEF